MNEEIKNLLTKIKGITMVASDMAGQALDTAGKRANELLDITRINIQIGEYSASADKVYREIGAMVYKTHKDPSTPSDDLPAKLAALDELHVRMAELKAKLEKIRKECACPCCGVPFTKEDTYCRSCGANVKVSVTVDEEPVVFVDVPVMEVTPTPNAAESNPQAYYPQADEQH